MKQDNIWKARFIDVIIILGFIVILISVTPPKVIKVNDYKLKDLPCFHLSTEKNNVPIN